MENENKDDVTTTTYDEAEVVENNDIDLIKAELAILKEERDRERDAKNAILARAKAAEAKLKEGKITQPEKNSNLNEALIDLRIDGYTREDADFILRNGGRKALDDANSYVSIAIKARREQRLSEEAASQTSQNSSQLSEVERKYTPEQLKNMSAKELEKILPHA
jgi:hypothetical protein